MILIILVEYLFHNSKIILVYRYKVEKHKIWASCQLRSFETYLVVSSSSLLQMNSFAPLYNVLDKDDDEIIFFQDLKYPK